MAATIRSDPETGLWVLDAEDWRIDPGDREVQAPRGSDDEL